MPESKRLSDVPLCIDRVAIELALKEQAAGCCFDIQIPTLRSVSPARAGRHGFGIQ